jgi:phosphate transport system substrate-binding protein
LLKLKLLTTVLAVGIGAAMFAACTPPPKVLAGAGSDTIFWAMSGSTVTQGTAPAHPTKGVSDLYNQSQTAVKTYEIPPVLTAPFPGPSYTVPAGPSGDACNTATVYNSSNPPPNGSSAGITALVNDTNGCIDWARSSRGSKAGDPANLSFWAFGLDAVTWVKFPQNAHGITSLTPAQLTSIYTCNPATHAPFIQTWNQIPGGVGAQKIVKYAPQTSSGTYSFVNSKLLGGATIDQNCDAAHDSIFLEEHDATGVSAANKANALYFFSYGQYVSQASGKLVDLRNQAQLGNINGVAPSTSSINETPSRFFGTRYVYNVTKSTSPQLTAVLNFVGVQASGPGYICNNTVHATLTGFGIAPLPLGGTGAGLPNSYCRLNPTPL